MKWEVIFDPEGLRKRIKELEDESLKGGFWDDQRAAQKVLKEKKSLEDRLGEYEKLVSDLEELPELIEIAEELEDEDEAKTVIRSFDKVVEGLEDFNTRMLLSGKYDSNDAILSIHSGTGGVDANDWAEMLERMYLRYCEKKGFKTRILDRQDDVDYGIKSSTIEVQGENAYGLLKSETGVHRLVRISPFNAMGKRQTSFAAVEVVPDIGDDIEVKIDPQDLKIDTYRSGGAGGQHVNTTDSAVRITHLPRMKDRRS